MRALSEFGPSAVPVKLFFFDCLKLLEHGDKNVRDSVKNLVIELYKWIKDGIKSFIADIKPVQLKELQEEFQKVADVSLKPTRFIGGSSKAPDNDVGGAADEVSETPAFDPLDMIEPVDVVSKIPSEFYSGIVQPKWQERKEALENLEKVFNTPKIKEGDFGEILSCIKKVISSDSNINVVAIAVKCVEHLANGLRKSFSQYASLFLPLIFDKLKEKRGAIVENCRNCLNACASCLDAENVINVALPYLKNKSPSVKEETVKFIGRFVISVGNKSPKNLVKSLVAELVKHLKTV
ncbi:Cytoskeleton-associated protein 5 [Thelohanellus kitauei]|uniref:Cytoskeleton-associated protein 5 n=1 Tax=Thelohanellus kitauei TaxID=669202 RepID=A0A0C2JAK8_THEKT|nr:Cytoskeleton-associated protein 5 [Thelohanellus kitauei]